MIFKNDIHNRFNDFKNTDSNGFQKLYDLLTKKSKDESEKKMYITEYQNIWLNIKNIFFKQKPVKEDLITVNYQK
jgi:hypothetical protein